MEACPAVRVVISKYASQRIDTISIRFAMLVKQNFRTFQDMCLEMTLSLLFNLKYTEKWFIVWIKMLEIQTLIWDSFEKFHAFFVCIVL